MALLKPKYYVSSFEHMSIERLKQQGIKLLLCDIDNTLVSYDEKHPSPSVIAFIDRVKSSGIEVALCSNATKERATRFSKDLNVSTTYYFSMKPLPKNFIQAMKKHNLKANQVAIIGDQMFTDILGGNLAGFYTILTAPIAVKDRGVTKINRFFENIVYKVLEHKGDFKRGEFDD